MDSGPVQALLLRDQPQLASAATGSAAANGAGLGLHVIASAFPLVALPRLPRVGALPQPDGRADQRWMCGELGGPGSGTGGEKLRDAEQVHGAGKSGSRDRGPRNTVKRPPGQGAVPGNPCLAGARQGQEPLPFLGLYPVDYNYPVDIKTWGEMQ